MPFTIADDALGLIRAWLGPAAIARLTVLVPSERNILRTTERALLKADLNGLLDVTTLDSALG